MGTNTNDSSNKTTQRPSSPHSFSFINLLLINKKFNSFKINSFINNKFDIVNLKAKDEDSVL